MKICSCSGDCNRVHVNYELHSLLLTGIGSDVGRVKILANRMIILYLPAMPSATDPPRPTPRQRWLAAQQLAAGACVEAAAAFAGIADEALDLLLLEPRFNHHVAAERAKLGLDEPAWQARLRGELRQAAERALADDKVSTLNTLLRLCLELPVLAAAPPEQREVLARALAAEAEVLEEAEPRPPALRPRRATTAEAAPAELLPPVEPDPTREALRQALLGRLNPALRPILAKATLELLEHYAAATDPDPTVYEAWHGARAKPPAEPVPLGEADLATIREVTRHNPPWLRGDYLGYFRPPVPAEAFALALARPEAAAAVEPVVAGAEAPVPLLRRRIERLLDRSLPRLPEELELAEAVCALRWPNWPRYAGPIDLIDLRVALEPFAIATETLHWLGSHELAQACRQAAMPLAP